MPDSPISVVVVDDHPLFRGGVVHALRSFDDVKVLGEGASADEAQELVLRLRPDVVLLDVSMPGGGINALRQIRDQWPKARVVMLTVNEADDTILQALDAGASGYVLKGVLGNDLVDAIREVAAGGMHIPPALAAKLVVASLPGTKQHTLRQRLATLSRKEVLVLRLMSRGFSNQEIGEATGVTVKTVKFHVSNILEKLDVKNRTEAALVGQKYLIEPP